jgi:hypothetical protein
VILGDDAPLVAALIWSAPVEQLDGHSLPGGPDLSWRKRWSRVSALFGTGGAR